MKVVVRSVVLLTLIFFAAHRQARAVDYYCPQGFYGYMNGVYMYFADYCDANGACQTAGVSVGTMYSCGGDFKCCNGVADNCVDAIPASALHLENESEQDSPSDSEHPKAREREAAAPIAPVPNDLTQITMLIGEQQQIQYLDPQEKFRIPGDNVKKGPDIIVGIPERGMPASYFRIFKVSHTDATQKTRTIYVGMEMNPTTPPTNAQSGVRKKKGQGAVFKHTISYQGDNYDVSSVRVLPDTP